MPGPPPQPIERKRLLGNPGKQALSERIIALPAATVAPKAPRSLGKEGREAWKRLWGVGRSWLQPESDFGLMLRLCEAWDERAILKRLIEDEGRVATGSMGQPVTHPAVDQLRSLDNQITRYEALCGFTPADRSRLGLAEVKRVSRLEEFLARRQRDA